ncbi:MAG: calcium/sodium antiporter [Bacteroidales bacterium]|nr:calcium/sodium antiporter [Bacteroidales bacterium]
MIYLFFVLGLILVVAGSDFLVDGASGIARKAHISEFVIGLTVVGFGTSCPELVVSVTGALAGNADVSIGNVLGSNIFNVLLILGLTAVILPIEITDSNLKRDIPVAFGVTILFVLLCLKGTLNYVDGILFLILFAVYIYLSFRNGNSEKDPEGNAGEMPLLKALILTAAGLAALIFGGKMFVDNAIEIARKIGVSDKFIAITLLAGGTSLPELATCIVAAAKKKGQLALGNILGSNVFNILLILGISSLISPLHTTSMNVADYVTLLLSTAVLFLCAFTFRKKSIDRIEGALLLLLEAAYFTLLVLNI